MFKGPTHARNALMDWLYDREEAVPDDVRDQLREYIKKPSPVDAVIECVKLVFDRLPDCGPELRKWASDTAIMCAAYAFDGIDEDIALILRPE